MLLSMPSALGQNVSKSSLPMLAFVERIGRRTYKHTTPPAERARKPLIQAAFKRLNANSPAVENKRFYSAFNPIPPPFPIHGKGGGSGGYIPRRAGGVAQPGQAVKGKPPQAAVLRTLDGPLPPVLNSRRRRGIYHQSPYIKIRGDNPIFKDGFLRNVIVSIYFLVFSSKTLRFCVPNKS